MWWNTHIKVAITQLCLVILEKLFTRTWTHTGTRTPTPRPQDDDIMSVDLSVSGHKNLRLHLESRVRNI